MDQTAPAIIRRSISLFFVQYHHFAYAGALLALPFSLSILLSQIILPSSFPSLLSTLQNKQKILFQVSGFSSTPTLLSFISSKLSQTVSLSLFSLPFTLAFLLLSKSFVILHLKPCGSLFPTFMSLLRTYMWNSVVIVSSYSTVFAAMFVLFSFMEGLGLSSDMWLVFGSAVGVVVCSVVLANAVVVCNLALIVAGFEGTGGVPAIVSAWVMIQGKTSLALSLAITINLTLVGVEALFRFRIVDEWFASDGRWMMGFEALFIAYIYSLVIVIDTIVSCTLYKMISGDAHVVRRSLESPKVLDDVL